MRVFFVKLNQTEIQEKQNVDRLQIFTSKYIIHITRSGILIKNALTKEDIRDEYLDLTGE